MSKKKDKKIVVEGEAQRKFTVIMVMILVVSLIIFALSLSWMLIDKQMKEKKHRLEGNVELSLNNHNMKGLIIEDAFPMNEDGGTSRESYNVAVINNGEEYVNYAVVLRHDEDLHKKCIEENEVCENVDLDKMRYKVLKDGYELDSKLLKDSQHVIDLGIVKPGEDNKIELEIQVWVDIEATDIAPNSKFFGKLEILTQTQ